MSNKLTEKQKRIGQIYCTKAMAAIHNPEKHAVIIKEFENWKNKEGIKI